MSTESGTVRILHIDDQPGFADMAATYLEREDSRFDVETATSASDGLERLADTTFDCIVSDYDMPDQNGIDLLETIREDYPDLPFILYTGKGSEEVASDAISAGATDYLQKETGTDQYELLANRIRNAVDQYRAQHAVAETERRLQTIAEHANDVLWKFTVDWNDVRFINSAYEEIWGRSTDELHDRPRSFLEGVHPDDRSAVKDAMERLSAGDSVDLEYRVNADEDFQRWVWVQGEPVFDDAGTVENVVGFARDITERKGQLQQLERERDRFSAIFEAIPEPIAHVHFADEQPIVKNVNTSFTDTFGADPAEIEGTSLDDAIVPDEYAEEARQMDASVRDQDTIEKEVERLATDGRRPFLFRSNRFESVDDSIESIGVYVELTGQKERERAIENLHDTAGAFMEARSGEEVADITVDALRDILDMPANGVHLYDEGAERLVPVAWTERTEEIVGEPPAFAPGEGIAGTAFETGEAQVYGDISTVADRYNPGTDVRSQIALPLGAHGVIVIGSPEPDAFDDTDVDLARTLAAHATTALGRIEHEQSLSEYETLVETVGDPMYILDAEGYIEMANETTLDYLDADRETVVGTHVREFMAEGDVERATDLLQELLADPDRDWATLEFTAVTTAGDRVPAELNIAALTDETGAFTGSVGVVRDISERIERERSLERLQRRTQAMMHTATREETAQVAVETARDVLGAPLSGCHLLGPDQQTLEPTAFVDIVSGELGEGPTYERTADDDPASQVVWQTFESGDPLVIEDTREYGRLAEVSPARSAIVHPLDGYGVFIVSATVPNAFDDTDRALTEIVATSLKGALERVEREQMLERRNERLDQFASVVSHDLRNPLNVAHGRLALAREECPNEHLDEAAGAIDRSLSLIDDLLMLAREGEQVSETEPIDLASVVDGCWGTVETADATLVCETDQTILADPSRLKQLLENLFRNAIEHGGDDVTVTVGALGERDGFYVADDGPGIPVDERGAVFRAGYSTTVEGTGFGLNIVQEIVEAHGWEITITDSEAGGARFEITGVDRPV